MKSQVVFLIVGFIVGFIIAVQRLRVGKDVSQLVDEAAHETLAHYILVVVVLHRCLFLLLIMIEAHVDDASFD